MTQDVKRRTLKTTLLLGMIFALFLVGCAKGTETILGVEAEQGLTQREKNAQYILGQREKTYDIENDYYGSGTRLNYNEDKPKNNTIKLTKQIELDGAKVYETEEVENTQEWVEGLIDNNDVYGDNIIHSDNRFDILYDIRQWLMYDIAVDGFQRLEGEALNKYTNSTFQVEASTWAKRLIASLEKVETYDILMNVWFTDMPDVVESWEEFKEQIKGKADILDSINSKADLQKNRYNLELPECYMAAYDVVAEINNIFSMTTYLEERESRVSSDNNWENSDSIRRPSSNDEKFIVVDWDDVMSSPEEDESIPIPGTDYYPDKEDNVDIKWEDIGVPSNSDGRKG